MPVTKLPSSLDAEQGILGSMLLSRDCAIEVIQRITDDYFYDPSNKLIYQSMIEAMDQVKATDMISMTQFLRDKGILNQVGGSSYVTSLFTFVPSASNYEHYIEIAKDKLTLRTIIKEAERLLEHCNDPGADASSLLAAAQSKLLDMSVHNGARQLEIADYANEALDQIEVAIANHGKIAGLSTGLLDLDRQLGGMNPGQMIVIAADTAQGKTSLALNIAEHLALNEKKSVGIISLEMSGSELTQRIIASHGKINLHKLYTEGMCKLDNVRIAATVAKIAESPLTIRDDSDVDFAQMRAIGRQMRQDKKVEVVVVDYIQLLTPLATKDDNRERAMSAVAQACKQMARELNCVVIILSQVNEQGKLRESRAIGHHADKVILLTHDDNTPGLCYADVVKNRQGPSGRVTLTFLRDYARFESYADL